jgi:exopolyphosphatase/pppGpp-phosphohydrolase
MRLELIWMSFQESKEAYFDYVGVSETLPATNAVIIDTGGASAEIVLVQNGKVSNLISIPNWFSDLISEI